MFEQIYQCKCHDPFQYLGLHYEKNNSIIRVYDPYAIKVHIILKNEVKEIIAKKVDNRGLFEVKINKKIFNRDYKLRIFYPGSIITTSDVYSFLPVISDYDLYLFNEGKNRFIYKHLGSHQIIHDGIKGVNFAVWAPNAKGVSVVGNFNNWDGRRHQMRVRGSSGVWELFIPNLKEGELYKFEIRTEKGPIVKIDPYGFYFEKRPKNANIVFDVLNNEFKWTDEEWMKIRDKRNRINEPISIYEVHLGSWKRKNGEFLSYRELAHNLVEYVKKMGFTHIELLPIMEHPLDASWGYQVTGYYAPTSRYGNPEDFKYFVNYMHENEIGVILDWVPAHFPTDLFGLARYDGTALYEHVDPRKGYHPDWNTYIFNYGRNEVKNFLTSNAIYWYDNYHVDGLRIDAVASMLYLDYSRKAGEWIPNIYGGNENLEAIAFLQELNSTCYELFGNIMMIAEESTAWPNISKPTYIGGLGFGYKWNMGWMNDTLSYFKLDPIYRKYHHNKITFSLFYAFNENFILPLSHDEVVHGKGSLINKMPGDEWQKFANLRLLLSYMWTHPGKKMLFMGGEFAQWKEWDFDSELDWYLLDFEKHRKLQKIVIDLNKIYIENPEFYEIDYNFNGFQWIDCNDSQNSVISFLRKDSSGNYSIIVCNFTPVVRQNYRVGCPDLTNYKEIFNSDSEYYGGANVGNLGKIKAEKIKFHGFDYSINLTLPPLGVIILKKDE